MAEEILDDRKVEEALQCDTNEEKGHSLTEIYREVSRLSAMNFFIQAMSEKYPGTTLYDLKQNLASYVSELVWDNTITENLAANLLQVDIEEVQKQVKAWHLQRNPII